jgi:hypothetical protein
MDYHKDRCLGPLKVLKVQVQFHRKINSTVKSISPEESMPRNKQPIGITVLKYHFRAGCLKDD